MPSEFLNIVGSEWKGVLATILTAGASAYVVSWVAFDRYRREKVWDQKIGEYNKLFEALSKMANSADSEISNFQSGMELSNSEKENSTKIFNSGKDELIRQINIGEVFLPNEVIDELIKLKTKLDKNYNSNQYIDMIIDTSNFIYTTLADLKRMARKDLIQPSCWTKSLQLLKKAGGKES